MERAVFADGALPKKQREFIAVGISVATDCESCMRWPIQQTAAASAGERSRGTQHHRQPGGAGLDDQRQIPRQAR
ncbi:MAG: carboxymuconolactone decarboxylase family protein [Candidatus Latescibacterota bacterium]